MKFCALASGSSGNCQYIETGEKKILVDAGLSGARVEKLLESIGVNPGDLDAVFVTHEHRDHVAGVGVLARRYGLDVFANEGTWKAMAPIVKKVPDRLCHTLENGVSLSYGDLFLLPFPTYHDCVEGSAFIVGQGGKKIALLTDTGWVSPEMKQVMTGSDLYYVEANHDEEMLINGPYSFPLKQRILSNRGHLSNAGCAAVLGDMLKKQGEKVILAHLSEDNNIPILAARTVRDLLYEKGIKEGTDFLLEVAKRREAGLVHEI